MRQLIRMSDNVEIRTATKKDLELAQQAGDLDCYPVFEIDGVEYYLGDE